MQVSVNNSEELAAIKEAVDRLEPQIIEGELVNLKSLHVAWKYGGAINRKAASLIVQRDVEQLLGLFYSDYDPTTDQACLAVYVHGSDLFVTERIESVTLELPKLENRDDAWLHSYSELLMRIKDLKILVDNDATMEYEDGRCFVVLQ